MLCFIISFSWTASTITSTGLTDLPVANESLMEKERELREVMT